MKHFARCVMRLGLVLLVACGATVRGTAEKSALCPPVLRAGQKFVYRVHFRAKKAIRAESRIASALMPEGKDSDIERWVSVEIKSTSNARVTMRTQLLPADGSPMADAASGVVEFVLEEDGRGSELHGFDALSGDEQAAWREWLAQFALGWTFPAKGVKPGEKWRKEEAVVGVPLDRLVWEKQYEYVRDEPCPQRGDDASAGKSGGECAVVVATIILKQHGAHDDATPEEYKVHQLKTSGTARGKSEVITYISLQSGFVERATEDSAQMLDVLIAKADDSNKAHFNVDATSHSDVVLLH